MNRFDNIDCMICGKTFSVIPARKTTAKYCSPECRYKSQVGRKHSEEFKKRQSELKKRDNPLFRYNVRKKISEGRKGKNNPNWKGGISYKGNDPRYTFEYKEWRRKVFARDRYTCQQCGAKSSKGKYTYLTAHHIKSFSQHPELRHDINNGITLCIQCHAKETGHEMLKNNRGYRKVG